MSTPTTRSRGTVRSMVRIGCNILPRLQSGSILSLIFHTPRVCRVPDNGRNRPTATVVLWSMTLYRVWSACVVLPLILPSPVQSQTSPPPGSIVSAEVHSSALEGNLLGDPPDQPVAVYVPPGYADSSRRYPVLYLLHGIGGSPGDWVGPSYQGMEIRAVMDSLIASGAIQPLIVVMPNGTNRYVGTFYMNSPVAGGWEDFVGRDLVAHVDRTYRTLARRESRGVAGHSMGGLGSILMGMRHADVFSTVWALNPCCLAMVEDISADTPAWLRAAAIRTLDDFDASLAAQDFYPPAIIALASVLSPRPDLPPLYVELPFRVSNGAVQPSESILARW